MLLLQYSDSLGSDAAADDVPGQRPTMRIQPLPNPIVDAEALLQHAPSADDVPGQCQPAPAVVPALAHQCRRRCRRRRR